LVAALTGMLSTTAHSQERPRATNLVAFYGNEPTTPLVQGVDRTLRESFRDPANGEIQFFSEFLDSGRFASPEYPQRLATFLKERYADKKVDLVFASGPVALDYVTTFHDQIFPGVPVVVLDVRTATLASKVLPPGFVGVGAEIEAEPTVRLALRLRPATREIVLLSGAAELDKVWEGRLRKSAAKVAPDLPVRSLSGLAMKDVERELAALPATSVVLGASFSRDGTGRYFPGAVAVLDLLRPSAAAPIFHVTMSAVGHGAVGTTGVPAEGLAKQAADIAKTILDGTPPAGVRLPDPLPLRSYIDWRELRRWGISESLLPADAVVLFREPSLWDQYRYHALAAVALIVLEAGLIAGLLIESRRRKQAELQAHVQRQALAHLSRVTTLGAMSVSIGHELNQPLAAILKNAEAARLFLRKDPADLAEVGDSLDDIIRSNQRAAEIIRNLRRMLSKEELPKQELRVDEVVSELLHLVASEVTVHQARIEVQIADDCPRVLADRTQLLQVLINLVINACDAMNAKPRSERLVVVRAQEAGRGVQLSIEDHGVGVPSHVLDGKFTPFVTTKAQGLGIGLTVCSSIVEAHGGRLRVTNKPGGGAIFTFNLPASATQVSDRGFMNSTHASGSQPPAA